MRNKSWEFFPYFFRNEVCNLKEIVAQDEWFGFTEDKVFGWLMENHDFCKFVLQTVLPEIEIAEIEILQSQKELNDPDPETKDVRLDVLVKDKNNVYYDVEMQVADKHNLGKRMRYYLSKLDAHYTLKKGKTYNDLKESYVIFLCDFDFFGKKKLRYVFHNYEDGDRSIMLPDGAHKIIINDKGDLAGNSKNLQDLARLMNDERIVDGDEMIDYAQNRIIEFNEDPKRRNVIVDYEVRLREREQLGERKGREEGLEKGIRRGSRTTALATLKSSIKSYRSFGISDEQILERILEDYSEYLSPEEIRETLKNE